MSEKYSKNWRPKILITQPEFPKEAIQVFQEKCDVTIMEQFPEPSREEILLKCKGMDGIVWATHHHLNAEVLDAAGPQLTSISTYSAGIDFVDVNELRKRGVSIGHTPKILNDAVADLTIGLLIAAARRFNEGILKVNIAEWETNRPAWMLGKDINGSTVGIVGLGGIGQEIAKRLKGFGIGKLLYTGHSKKIEDERLNAEFVTFDELLTESDFVIVSCPLTNETKGMFNEEAFNKMKTSSVFINIARGDIVDHIALVKALENGKLFAAGLDVTSPEPFPISHPLLKLPNCIIIPHLGSATWKARLETALLASHNVLKGVFGEMMVSPVP